MQPSVPPCLLPFDEWCHATSTGIDSWTWLWDFDVFLVGLLAGDITHLVVVELQSEENGCAFRNRWSVCANGHLGQEAAAGVSGGFVATHVGLLFGVW